MKSLSLGDTARLLASLTLALCASTPASGDAGVHSVPSNPCGIRDSVARHAVPLTAGSAPSLSPNGRLVAFTRNTSSVWIFDLKTSKVRLLTCSAE